jgi:hypothetical protein
VLVGVRKRLRDSGLAEFSAILAFKPLNKLFLAWARVLREVVLA